MLYHYRSSFLQGNSFAKRGMRDNSMDWFNRGNPNTDLLIIEELTANARGQTVTEETLMSHLPDDVSVLSALQKGEQPQFILHNRGKELRYNDQGEENTVEPDSDYWAFCVITDDRVLFLTGVNDTAERRTVDYGDIESVESSRGLLKRRLDIRTLYANYQFYVSKSVSSDEFEQAISFLEDRAGLNNPNYDVATGASFQQASSTPRSSSATRQDDQGITRVTQPTWDSNTRPLAERPKEQILQWLQEMDPYDFEHFVADLWQARGWETTVSQESVDQGVDVIATKENPFPEKQVIQAKRYSSGNTVGSPKVQQYSSLREQEDGADAAVIVTTSTFSRQAEDLGQKLNVKLVDSETLYRLLEETGRFDLVSKYALPPNELDAVGSDSQNQPPTQKAPSRSTDTEGAKVSTVEETLSEETLLDDDELYCPNCETFSKTSRTWRRDLILPIHQCDSCETLFHNSDGKSTLLEDYVAERDSGASEYGYYSVATGFCLAILGLAVPPLGILAWGLLLFGISRDTRYVRTRTERNPPTGYWVWGVILLPLLGAFALGMAGVSLLLVILGGAYLVRRYRLDSATSNLHHSRTLNFVEDIREGE